MKKLFFSFLFLLFSIVTYAQTIGGFLDFYLGQSKSEVQNIVNSKYRGAEWDHNSCKIEDISLAGESFNRLTLDFQNGILTSAICFRKFDNPWIDGYNNAERFFEYAQQEASNMMSRLYATYKSKYGRESASTNDAIIWRANNGNSIKIAYRQQFINQGMGGYSVNCAVSVHYISSNSGNF